jgi:hypothetical protein
MKSTKRAEASKNMGSSPFTNTSDGANTNAVSKGEVTLKNGAKYTGEWVGTLRQGYGV